MLKFPVGLEFFLLLTTTAALTLPEESDDNFYPPVAKPRLDDIESQIFSYDEEAPFGPSNWKLLNPQCGGSQQSPINIETRSVQRGKAPPLYMSYYAKPVVAINVTNTGHSVNFQLNFADSRPNRLLWNGIGGQSYILDSLHFHWGNYCGGGSEHTVDGHRYAAEVHLVHYNEKYRYLNAATMQPDGLAVVGVFFELAEEANNDGSNNNKFTKFLANVRQPRQSYLVTDTNGIFSVQELIKNELNEYYSYKGSLTTPPCLEVVRWIISKKPVKIYPSELAALASVLKENTSPLAKNYRPLQQINGRNIYEYDYSGNKLDQILWKLSDLLSV